MTRLALMLAVVAILAAPLMGEEVRSWRVEGATVTLDASDVGAPEGPVEVVIYALPNGSSTAETMGRRPREGDSWRFDIQHIGAQTRWLRAHWPARRVVVAYLEADGKAWPRWRRETEDAPARALEILEQILEEVPGSDKRVTLTGHSGGGSYTFALLDAVEQIPASIHRIAFLDSNYGYVVDAGYGKKLAEWLARSPQNRLLVFAYDDRHAEFNGRRFVSSTGGTMRATLRMAGDLKRWRPLEKQVFDEYIHWKDEPGRFHIVLYTNPELKILHTVMVGEYNGLIHAMTLGTESERTEWLLGPRIYTEFVEGAEVPGPIPPRHPDLPGATAFYKSIQDLPREERERAIEEQLLRGNIPDFMRKPLPVVYRAEDANGSEREVTLFVLPDYLCVGSNEDYARIPMNPYTAQAVCDAFGYTLPTRRMVNEIWNAAEAKLDPLPLTEERESPATFLHHHRLIEEQLEGVEPGVLVAGIKKDVVVTNRLGERPNRVAIFGWHYPDGKPIQPLTIVHVDWYVDYSHGARMVEQRILVDGEEWTFDAVAQDEILHPLVSDEGVLEYRRYER